MTTRRSFASITAVAATIAGLALAQAPAAKTWTLPRTPDGTPDLQGVYANATLTPLERPKGLAKRQGILHGPGIR